MYRFLHGSWTVDDEVNHMQYVTTFVRLQNTEAL